MVLGADAPLFEKGVEQIFRAKCLACHGANKQKRKAELDLRWVSAILKGGESGPAVVPGKLDESILWDMVSTGEMPPEEKNQLTQTELDIVKSWILKGAKTKQKKEAETEHLEARNFWSFQKLQRPQPPTVKTADSATTAIDQFLIAALAKKGLTFSGPANRRTLIRRLSLDLTGLPPTPEQIDEFLKDQSPRAYDRLVDRLLDSPHYGEHWGQHWLDVVGYSDSDGYHRKDTPRPLAYRYRDYIIDSFNKDKPYDQLWVEQLAGDELVDIANLQEYTPEVVEKLVATHFLRNGPDGTASTEGNEIARTIERYAVLEQLQQITVSSMFALTIDCARCHSHKFDPIPQPEYYGLQAIFYPAFNVKSWVTPKDRYTRTATPKRLAAWKAEMQKVDTEVADLNRRFSSWVQQNRPRANIIFEETFSESAGKLNPRWSNTIPGDDAPAGKIGVNVDSANAPAARVDGQTLQMIAAGDSHAGILATREKFDWTPEKEGDWIQATFDLVQDKVNPQEKPAERIAFYISLLDDNDSGSVPGGNVFIDGNPAGKSGVYVDYPGKDARKQKDIGQAKYQTGRNYGVRVTNAGKGQFRLEQLADWIPETPAILLKAEDLPDGAFGFENCCGRSFVVDNISIETGAGTGDSSATTTESVAFAAQIKKKHQELLAQIQAMEAQRAKEPGFYVAWVTDLSPDAPKVSVLKRGRYFDPGPDAIPTALGILSEPGFKLDAKRPFASSKTTGRRLAFARWATKPGSRAAALLARVQVNRIWMWHFGNPLIETPENFGVRGSKPSHPKLLEWLAAEFVESGWSTKHLHRLIVKSQAYRQAYGTKTGAVAVDPENRLLWSFPVHRLESETIRDSMLMVSGTLNRQMNGPPVEYQKNAAGQILITPKKNESTAAGNRRSLYLRHRRSEPITFLATFDQASPEPNCLRRSTSTVVSQSLEMLNGQFALQAADAFAKRIEQAAKDDQEKQVQTAFQFAFGRSPLDNELGSSQRFLEYQASMHTKAGAKDKTQAEHRALVDFCQVLFASNEFIYLQ